MPQVSRQPSPPPPPPAARLVTAPLVRVFAASLGAMSGFFLLLSVVPLYATTSGAGEVGAGLATGALLFATVAAELATLRLVARFGYRVVFAAGLLLLGAPTLAMIGSAQLPAILAVSTIRGLGFGIVVVLGSALVASLVPAQRRGEGLGLHGVVIGVPGVVALPFGVFLAGQAGYPLVFVIATVVVLSGLLVVPGLPGHPGRRPAETDVPQPDPEPSVGLLTGLRTGPLLRPALVFTATATAGGIVVTFLPLAVDGGPGYLAVLALFGQVVAATVARWWAGRFGDRHGPARLVVPGLLAGAAGVLGLVLIGSPVAVVAGMLLFGAGFGVSQNATLSLMFSRVSRSGYGTVSAMWNLAFDIAMGLGAVGFGVLVAQTGYPAAFAVTGALMLVALVPARLDRRPAPAPGGVGDR
ncbi:MAG: MFS transporter [Natronosporangium sp.]